MQLDAAQQRLLDAYLATVLDLESFQRKHHKLLRRQESLHTQRRQLEAVAQQQIALSAVTGSLEDFCSRVREGLSGQPSTSDERSLSC